MSGDSTSIMDLPTDPVGGGNITLNASENVVQKQMQQPSQMPQQGQTPNFSLDQTTISIKTAMKNFDESNDIQFVRSVGNIYINELKPIMKQIMRLKYKENTVIFDETDNTYHLIQKNYSIKDLEMNSDKYETVVFDTSVQRAGPSLRTDTKKRRLVVDSSSAASSSSSSESSTDIIGKLTRFTLKS